MSNHEERAVASTIIGQIGGQGRLHMMLGATNFMSLPIGDGKCGGLRFNIKAIGKPRINIISIELNGGDLYDISYYFMRAGKAKLVAEERNVFNTMLKPMIEKTTGLYLSFTPSWVKPLPTVVT
jgi:hypothetical protein